MPLADPLERLPTRSTPPFGRDAHEPGGIGARPEAIRSDKALGLYVHWPYCARICPYCDFNVFRDRGREAEPAALVDAICRDLEHHRARTGPRDLVSIFFGGGTPSLMPPESVARIIDLCRALWPSQGASPGPLEITLEANPTDAEATRFSALAAAGVTRLSLGVQSLTDTDLVFLGRNHGAAEARRAAVLARTIFPQLSLDFIYALPGQTLADWQATLASALDLSPDHLSPYQLTIEPGTAFDRAVRRQRFAPADDARGADLYDLTQSTLAAAGFTAYEVSNHARGPDARSRHNLLYWRGEAYVGVGPGAHGRLDQAGAWIATVAASKPADYIATVEAQGTGVVDATPLSAEERSQERLMMGLRTLDGTAWADLAPLGLTPQSPGVVELVTLGLLATDDRRLQATAAGRRVLDAMIRHLLLD